MAGGKPAGLEQRAACQRIPVAVQALALDPEDDVAGSDLAAVDDLVEIDAADRHCHEVEAVDHVS